jgi:hypothetical protein
MVLKQGKPTDATIHDDGTYTIHGDGSVKLDPIIKERLFGVARVLNSLQIDAELWKLDNPIWRNSNNHVMFMLRQYYYANETDEEMKVVFGSIIDHIVWLYVTAPEIRARIGWMVWFMVVYITDNQFKKEVNSGFVPEVWTDPRKWALAAEAVNPITTTLTPVQEGDRKV